MIPNSPADALGPHAPGTRDLLVETVRSRHTRFAEAHQISGSRYSMGFGTQWRDLLDDVHDVLANRGFQSYKLNPGGYKIPVVNDCLVYVWRVPDTVDDPSLFASSPTRKNGFAATPPDPMLFDPLLMSSVGLDNDATEGITLAPVEYTDGSTMPLVLVMVRSSHRQLQSIEWAVAELITETSEVTLHGQQSIWQPEPVVATETPNVEPFDSGAPVMPVIAPQKQENSDPDA